MIQTSSRRSIAYKSWMGLKVQNNAVSHVLQQAIRQDQVHSQLGTGVVHHNVNGAVSAHLARRRRRTPKVVHQTIAVIHQHIFRRDIGTAFQRRGITEIDSVRPQIQDYGLRDLLLRR